MEYISNLLCDLWVNGPMLDKIIVFFVLPVAIIEMFRTALKNRNTFK